MDDWDLLAVVRGRNSSNYNMEMESPISSYINNIIDDDNIITTTTTKMELSSLKSHHLDDNFLFNAYPHLFETATAFDELEELYKPFYPGGPAGPAAASSLSSSSTSALSPLVSLPEQAEEVNVAPQPKIAKEPVNKYKKRKNQQKRVVKEVREDGLGSDMWAWRKYGQKPIKGSPFPRSYYRCSSSKGCSARKQVERSPIDPSLFIITYTADHTHPHPARRNSLAGTTRTKSPPGPPNNAGPSDDKARVIKNRGLDRELSATTEEEGNIVIKMECDDLILHDQSSSELLFAELDACELVASNNNNNNNNSNNGDDHQSHNQSELLFLDDRLFVDLDDNNWFVDQYSNATLTGAC